MNIVINGAGIAGPTLAYWLTDAGHDVLLVEEATDIYFDSLSQIRMDHWARDRTALIGDAAACVSLLAGEGTGLAMAEAYVLTQALRSCEGDLQRAFASYENCLMPFLKRKQGSAARFASSFVPKTALGIAVRNVATAFSRYRSPVDGP